MILSKAEIGKDYLVLKISANQKDKIKLYKLGVFKMQTLRLVNKIAGGGVIISVKFSDIVVGKNVAEKITVEKL
ncbi:MAG: ferrous iron transport protein A [Clostridia bacterium]|nr:ferrous iron transport protein A [Clostridia bacterium]